MTGTHNNNHPHHPTPAEILARRKQAGITQREAGALLHATVQTFQQWEYGTRGMSPRTWELFTLKTAARVRTPRQ